MKSVRVIFKNKKMKPMDVETDGRISINLMPHGEVEFYKDGREMLFSVKKDDIAKMVID